MELLHSDQSSTNSSTYVDMIFHLHLHLHLASAKFHPNPDKIRMACVVVLSLMRTLELEFLQPRPRPILQQKELIPCNKDLVLSLHKKLGFLMELLDENRMDGVEAIKKLETKLRDVAFRVEDEIELQVVHLYGEEEEEEKEEGEDFRTVDLSEKSTHHCQRLHQILHPATGKSHPCPKFRRILHRAKEDIDAIEEEVVKVKMEYNHFMALQGKKTTFDELVKMDSSSKHASHSKNIMVGKNNEFHHIKEMLIEHPSRQLEIVSINGMGGIGKTTLARRVYEDPSIASHFDKRAWVVASQHYNKRQMLEGLLSSMGNAKIMLQGHLLNSVGNAGSGSDEDLLALLLYQGFKGLRYLVVIDDIWGGDAWDAIKACLPDDINGSRVLLTTRLAKIANHTCSEGDFSYQMSLLNQSESWDLFYEKACKSSGLEFETIGRPIVDKCKGLPLAIVVIAGLFSKLNTLDEWKNIANSLIGSSSATTLDDEECSRILSLSYNHLPHNLKACFLYLGVFPEDHEIKANDLARLWFAEGLVNTFENESFDAVANRYIQDLMDRNLIILSKLSSCGRKIKWFRMHDLLHAFCVREAQNENLLHVVNTNGSNFSHKGFRWVSIQSKDFDMPTILSRSKSCRSFFYYFQPGALILNAKNFNILRVSYCIGHIELGKIVHLRFLNRMSRKSNMELSRAWNLQTLDLKSPSIHNDFGGKYLEFPQLQHILCRSFLGIPPKFVQKLSRIRADYCSKEFIANIPYLKKLYIFFGHSRDCNDWIMNLAYLEQLEGLHIYGDGIHKTFNNYILLLENLRKLSLFCIRFEWKEINILGKLPKLEVLKLGLMSCTGEEWEIPEEVIFWQLICLYIYGSDPKHWKARSHNFPKLERLLLYFCYKLQEIPIDFAEISTLKSIKLWKCIPSLVESAKKIQNEQCDYGNYNMVVIEEDTL